MIIEVIRKDGSDFLLDVEINLNAKAVRELEEFLREIFVEELGRDVKISPDEAWRLFEEHAREEFEQMWIAAEDPWIGTHERDNYVTGWWDLYDGELTKEEEKIIDEAIKRSKTLYDVLVNLGAAFAEANALFDRYFEDAAHFIREGLEVLEKKGLLK